MSCLTPFGVRHKITNETIPVPCGKCPECLKRRISGWSFRLMQEDKQSISSMFITLTYDTNSVPITKNGFMGLRKNDVQKFFKRLRKQHESKNGQNNSKGTHGSPSIKYYAVGEYGGRTKRPHYHAILFNADINLVQAAWKLGQVHYGTVTGASVGYTLKYMSKPSKVPMHRNDDRDREFSLMSKGLGKNYLSQKMINWHKNDLDNRMYCNLQDGKKIAMPRYYKDKIYEEHERKRVAFFARQKMVAEQLKAIKENPDYYRDKAESDQAAFAKANLKSQEGRNKV